MDLIAALAILAIAASPDAPEERMPAVLPAELAGTWYPADPQTLRQQITGLLAQATDLRLPRLGALILPHAGYRWCGAVAAEAVRQVQGRACRRVVILGPSHRLHLPDAVAIPEAGAIATPLGEVPCDAEALRLLAAHPCVRRLDRAHRGEHSVQILLPWLQVALERFTVVPVVVGQLQPDQAQAVADALRPLLDDATLLVVSTDFTHQGADYGYQPFTDRIAEQVKELDLRVFQALADRDPLRFERLLDETGATVCGRHPLAVLLRLLGDGDRVDLLRHDTSASISGDASTSVSYLAAAVVAPVAWATTGIDAASRQRLLALARACIAARVTGAPAPVVDDPTPAMRRTAGVFVSLKHRTDGSLRGCIGEILPTRALHRAVADQAVASAVHDPRFDPVAAEELPGLRIEISALDAPRPVASWRDIVIGRHGIILTVGAARAVFLPQVAPEQGWNLEETLEHLARKAGLAADAWRRDDARFDVFTAEVFGEE